MVHRKAGLMKKLFGALLLTCMAPAIAGWRGGVAPESGLSPGRASIAYLIDPSEGSPAFSDALEDLLLRGKVHRLEFVSLQQRLREPSFQDELMIALKRSAPRQLARALRSRGGLHERGMYELRPSFASAVLTTPTVKEIDSDLARYGLNVSGVEMEKLELWEEEGERIFMCIVLVIRVGCTKREA